MLKIFSGNNSFLRQAAWQELRQRLDLTPNLIKGEVLSLIELNDLLSAQSLFEAKRCLLAYNLSEQPVLWQRIVDLAPSLAADDSLVLVLIEDKLDQRTKFAKLAKKEAWWQDFSLKLDKNGQVIDYTGDTSVKFILEQSTKLGLKIAQSDARYLFERVGAEPWDLFQALERLALLEEINREQIDRYIPANKQVNLFEILQKALLGQSELLESDLNELEASNTEVQQFFGLLSSQILQLLAIMLAPAGADLVQDFAINPFVLTKLRHLARGLTIKQVRQTVALFSEVDQKIKSGSNDPWLEIKALLLQVALIK